MGSIVDKYFPEFKEYLAQFGFLIASESHGVRQPVVFFAEGDFNLTSGYGGNDQWVKVAPLGDPRWTSLEVVLAYLDRTPAENKYDSSRVRPARLRDYVTQLRTRHQEIALLLRTKSAFLSLVEYASAVD